MFVHLSATTFLFLFWEKIKMNTINTCQRFINNIYNVS